MSTRFFANSKDREKSEQELFVSVKKAVSSSEDAPKQKHVRIAILFSHDYRTAEPFYTALKSQPLLQDEIQSFKALILIHKVTRDGDSSVLQETMRQVPFLDLLAQQHQQYTGSFYKFGYSQLILAYIRFVKYKLEFHTMHPEFTADLNYEEYRALRKVDEPNEGYNAISELMNLLERLFELQSTVFQSFKPSASNELRISALVPLVEESFGIYKFNTSMLSALHSSVPDTEVLKPLTQRFNVQYDLLRKFYFECSNLRYLTSLITVPNLPATPPNFHSLPRSKSSQKMYQQDAPKELIQVEEDIWNSNSMIARSSTQELNIISSSQMQPTALEHQQGQEIMMLRIQLQQAQQLVYGYQSRMNELESAIQQYEKQRQTLMLQSSNDAERDRQLLDKDELISQLQQQVAYWKQKYENIAKMYAQLRKEHLEILGKLKEMQNKITNTSKIEEEKARAVEGLKVKQVELHELNKEKDKFKIDLEMFKEHSSAEINRLTRELSDQKAKYDELSKSRGSETQSLISKYEQEKLEQGKRLADQTKEYESLKMHLLKLKAEFDSVNSDLQDKNDEIAILQSAMDQSLMALKIMQEKNTEEEASLHNRMDQLSLEHRSHMDKIMDSVLEDCKAKVGDSSFELESTSHVGNPNVTPELVLSLIEKLSFSSNDFATSFMKHLVGNDASGEIQAEAIRHANLLSQNISALMYNLKGLTKLAGDDSVNSSIISSAKIVAQKGSSYFGQLQSSNLNNFDYTARPQKVQEINASFLSTLPNVINLAESLVPKDISSITQVEDELGDFVENELSGAAKAIEEAAAALMKLLSSEKDPKLTQTDLQVHQSILLGAKAITDAIAKLIICATHSQQEIVNAGKGSGTKGAFYKKNSRWMEGLISAAKAVAAATKFLVDAADGVVHGTKNMEQLLVAAHEVAGATAQLVAASRVKAIRGSKTQDKLEVAAKAVTEATKMLVEAAELARKKSSTTENVDYSKLSPHDFKKKEMEQQVQIMTLEKNLADARKRLGEMRRQGYHKEADYGNQS